MRNEKKFLKRRLIKFQNMLGKKLGKAAWNNWRKTIYKG